MRLIALEKDRTQTLLGLRFWDRLTNQVIADGLSASAQRLSADRTQRLGKPVLGRLTPNGIIAFIGLSPHEKPAPEVPDLWDTQPPDHLVVVDVVDRRSRFLPLSFVAQLPFRGPFLGRGGWLSTTFHRPPLSAAETLGIQLWSAPARPLPPGRAVIRAQLVEALTDTPAAFAVVRCRLANSTPSSAFDHYGLTDDKGQLVLPVPYPDIPDPPTANDPYPALDQQIFELIISVRYTPNLPRLPSSTVPNLERILTQPPARIGNRVTGTGPPALRTRSRLNVSLRFGVPLTLLTQETPSQSVLRIQPA